MRWSRSVPIPLLRRVAACAVGIALVGSIPAAVVATAAPDGRPQVVDVPSRPAYVRPPGGTEAAARVGQTLVPATLLRTQKPGRLQVRLPDGRRFRLGGDSLLRVGRNDLDLLRGQVIGWIAPGSAPVAPLRIRTRVGTASIQGTTVFLEADGEEVLILSWEGTVSVEGRDGSRFRLGSGEVIRHTARGWEAPRRLDTSEAQARRRRSVLLDGFRAPMETLPVIERELGIGP